MSDTSWGTGIKPHTLPWALLFTEPEPYGTDRRAAKPAHPWAQANTLQRRGAEEKNSLPERGAANLERRPYTDNKRSLLLLRRGRNLCPTWTTDTRQRLDATGIGED